MEPRSTPWLIKLLAARWQLVAAFGWHSSAIDLIPSKLWPDVVAAGLQSAAAAATATATAPKVHYCALALFVPTTQQQQQHPRQQQQLQQLQLLPLQQPHAATWASGSTALAVSLRFSPPFRPCMLICFGISSAASSWARVIINVANIPASPLFPLRHCCLPFHIVPAASWPRETSTMAVALMERLTPAATTNGTGSGSRRIDSCYWPKNNRDTYLKLRRDRLVYEVLQRYLESFLN